MKLIIQIPCLNEEKTLPSVLRDLPTCIDGIDVIETQVIDDGSMDRTAEIAQEAGVDYIIRFHHNSGLAAAFQAGVENALLHDADILVNTDGDNQYNGSDITKLVCTMIEQQADLVIGCRPIANHPEFSIIKRWFQLLGSWVVRHVSNTTVPDTTSGFRAYSRQALLQLNIVTTFSYCLETIIQAGLANMKVAHTPICVNRKTRPSRLFRNIAWYIYRQLKTIVQMFIIYRSNEIFNTVSLTLILGAIGLSARYMSLAIFEHADAGRFWPSIVLASVLAVLSGITYLSGMLASLLSAQRKISEEMIYHLRCLNLKKSESGELRNRSPQALRKGTLLCCSTPLADADDESGEGKEADPDPAERSGTG
jgi:glycosyltransferase involved in cell wall biosynthesis